MANSIYSYYYMYNSKCYFVKYLFKSYEQFSFSNSISTYNYMLYLYFTSFRCLGT